MERALGKFIEFCKMPPRRVIFFRDGVSEGEYSTVAAAEIEAIQGTFGLINTCTQLIELSIFSCYQDHRRESGLQDPCDVHCCGQTVTFSFFFECRY